MRDGLPTIVIPPLKAPRPASLGAPPTARSGEWQSEATRQTGRLLNALIEEGRRFATTPRGRSWHSSLVSLDLVAKGWVAWNLFDLDAVVAAGTGETDTLGALHSDLQQALSGADPPRADLGGASLG